jgi:hypothetical protein
MIPYPFEKQRQPPSLVELLVRRPKRLIRPSKQVQSVRDPRGKTERAYAG